MTEKGMMGIVMFAMFAMLGTLALPRTVQAQATVTGEIRGTVTSREGKPVAGASVVVAGPQGKRRATTSGEGAYRIELLPPGSYDVEIAAPGYRPVSVEGVSVRLDNRSQVDAKMKTGESMEEILVTGSSVSPIDITKTSVSAELTSDLLSRVPIGRSISDTLILAPGVSDPGSDVLAGNPSISGASGLENTYFVDGVNVTNSGYGSMGTYSIRYGSMGGGVNFDFVDTVQVKSAGFEAEYGHALGGVVNVITKRGTNEFHGSLFSYYSPGALEASRRKVSLQVGNSNTVGYEEWDTGFTLGGPIIKDKLFFFTALDPQQSKRRRSVNDSDPDGDGSIDFPLGGRKWTTERYQSAYAGNVSWNILEGHRLTLSVFGDPGRTKKGPQSGADLLVQETTRFSELEFGGHNQVLRYDGVITNWLTVEAQVARAENTFAQGFPARNNQRQVIDYTTPTPTRIGGIGFYEKKQKSDNNQYQVKATGYFKALGTHEVKAGLSYEDVGFNVDRNRTGATQTVVDRATGERLTTETGVLVYRINHEDHGIINRVIRGSFSGASANTSSDYFSVFVQDGWSPVQDLTLSLGLRAEQQRLTGTARSYTFKMSDNIAPRVGASWDFTSDGRGKLYANFGRFYEKIPNDLAVRLFSPEYGITRADFVDADGDGRLTPDDEQLSGDDHFRTVGGEPTEVADGTKSQFQDELVLGAEYEVFEDWNVGARWIHRQVGRVLEDFQTSTSEGITVGSEDTGGYVVGNPSSRLNSTCPANHPNCWVDPVRQYDALEITLNKRFARRWQLHAWYRLGRLWGNYEGLFRNDNGQSDPNLTSLFDFPNNTTYTAEELQTLGCSPDEQACIDELPAPMQGQGKKGLLNTNRTHMFQVAGSYTTDFGFTVGLVGRFQTGTPISGFKVHPVYENDGEVPVGKRGKYGTTANTYTLDLHAGYEFELGDGWKANALVDVRNVMDSQKPVGVVQDLELALNTPDPDFLAVNGYQSPRQVQLGLKVAF